MVRCWLTMASSSPWAWRATSPAARTPRQIDAAGLILAPGFIDLQINGAFGDDFTADPATIWRVAEGLPRYGVTAFLPTIITSPLEQVAAGQRIVTEGEPAGFRGARPLGLHVEGPFLNPQKKGAHNPKYLRLPSVEAVAGWSPATGIRLVTLAPELPWALEVIVALSDRGVLVSEGHSMATYDQAAGGVRRGRALRHAPLQRHAGAGTSRSRPARRAADGRTRHRGLHRRWRPHPPVGDQARLAGVGRGDG